MVKQLAEEEEPVEAGKSRMGRVFRSRFWNGSTQQNSLQRNTISHKDPIAKQFDPKRPVTNSWIGPETNDDEMQFTPFKTNTMGRQSQVRGATPVSQQDIGQKGPVNGYIPHMSINRQQQQQLHPKNAFPHGEGRLERSGSGVSGGYLVDNRRPLHYPQQQWSGQSRPNSAMAGHFLPRTYSRANSEILTGMPVGLGSRYQSYCTLPRPDILDIDQQQQQQGFAMVRNDQQSFLSNTAMKTEMRHQQQQQQQYLMMMGEQQQPDAIYPQPPPEGATTDRDMIQSAGQKQKRKRKKEPCGALNWPLLLKLSLLLILLSSVIFGLGLARILLLAKWSLGVELGYALFLLLSGLIGFIGSYKRHHCCIVAALTMTVLSTLLVIPPFIIGLMPTIPWTLQDVDSSYFVSESEPFAVDIALSAVCLLALSIAIVMASVGCCAMAKTMQTVDRIFLDNIQQSPSAEDKSTSTVNLIY